MALRITPRLQKCSINATFCCLTLKQSGPLDNFPLISLSGRHKPPLCLHQPRSWLGEGGQCPGGSLARAAQERSAPSPRCAAFSLPTPGRRQICPLGCFGSHPPACPSSRSRRLCHRWLTSPGDAAAGRGGGSAGWGQGGRNVGWDQKEPRG